jgi:hypothetical protein
MNADSAFVERPSLVDDIFRRVSATVDAAEKRVMDALGESPTYRRMASTAAARIVERVAKPSLGVAGMVLAIPAPDASLTSNALRFVVGLALEAVAFNVKT